MADDDLDIAGFCVGEVAKDKLVDGRRVESGDAIVGLAASGPHSNGFSLIRRVLGDDPPEADLLVPTRIYAPEVAALLEAVDVRAMCARDGRRHRGQPAARAARRPAARASTRSAGPSPPGCSGSPPPASPATSCGACSTAASATWSSSRPATPTAAIATAESLGTPAWTIGEVEPGPGRPVRVAPCCAPRRPPTRCGSACSSPAPAEPAGAARHVQRRRARGARGRRRAPRDPACGRWSGRPTAGVPHDVFAARPTTATQRLADWLDAHDVELVVCAGWMGILTPGFLERHVAINLHPALLPSFPGAHAVQDALDHGVRDHRRDGALRRRRAWTPGPSSCKLRCRFTTMTTRRRSEGVSTRRSIGSSRRRSPCSPPGRSSSPGVSRA